jgi:uncharacterized coiled-coil DUF342 family protein
MSELIEDFKKEHSEIIEAFKEADELGILTKEGHAKLMSIKATLLEHLKEENEKFYPVLREAAGHNMKLKEALEVFAKDLEHFSKLVFVFFDRFDKGYIGENLSIDFEILFLVIRNRMKNEENFLYDEFEELNKL